METRVLPALKAASAEFHKWPPASVRHTGPALEEENRSTSSARTPSPTSHSFLSWLRARPFLSPSYYPNLSFNIMTAVKRQAVFPDSGCDVMEKLAWKNSNFLQMMTTNLSSESDSGKPSSLLLSSSCTCFFGSEVTAELSSGK